ncbi:cyclic nucleotide-binding domain-containing protein, partial [bacterium]
QLELRRYPAGEVIIKENEPGRGLYVLRSGVVGVLREGKQLAELQPGSILGEIGFVTGAPRTATVETLRDSEVFSIPNITEFLARYPGLRSFLMETAQHRMLELSRLSNFQKGATMPAMGGAQSPMRSLLAGRYEVSSQLGEGGMGTVHLGFDRSLERKVAIKRVRSEYAAEPTVRARFMSEARLAARLSHPYIVAVHDIIEEGGELFLVMEYVDGRPLDTLIAEGRRFTLADCETLFSFVCQAVACAHWNHVLHLDLKPGNIMLDRMGFAKVMDFGLAKRGGAGPREISGTPTHMAPEQHRAEYGPGSDVYALGVCLYEMLTGFLPYAGPDFVGQKKRPPAPASTFVPALADTGVDELLASALSPDMAKRPAGALPFLEALKAVRKA